MEGSNPTRRSSRNRVPTSDIEPDGTSNDEVEDTVRKRLRRHEPPHNEIEIEASSLFKDRIVTPVVRASGYAGLKLHLLFTIFVSIWYHKYTLSTQAYTLSVLIHTISTLPRPSSNSGDEHWNHLPAFLTVHLCQYLSSKITEPGIDAEII